MIDPKLIDTVLPFKSGYPESLAKQDTREELCAAVEEHGGIVTDFPDHLWIEPKDWAEVAQKNDEMGLWPDDFVDRFTNQGKGNGGYSTHECTCHCLVHAFESAWNRQRRIRLGPPTPLKRLPISEKSASVWMSCLSIYSRANPRQWGGANVRQVLSIAAKYGFIPDKIQPKNYGFKHSLQGTCGAGGINQSRGNWVSVANFPEGCEETSQHFRPIEWIFPISWEQTICLVLNSIGVGVGRSGHSVWYGRWNEKDRVMRYPDSYDIFRYDSISNIKKTVGGSYAIVSTTIPDDWERPAG